jgi:predicted PurR-regulated permease PerM
VPPGFPIFSSSSSEARTETLQGLLIAALVVSALYVGREVLLPLAVAMLLSFVLTPMLLLLRRFKVPRVLGVGIVVTVAFAVIFLLGWLLSQQAAQLVEDFPRYRGTISEKIGSLRSAAERLPILAKASDAVKDLRHELAEPKPKSAIDSASPSPAETDTPQQPIPVEIQDSTQGPLELFQLVAGTILSPLATAGIVLLFVIFILIQREELRDKAIRLLASSDMQRATSAMNDAAERLSKYFLSQLLINSAYGAFMATGLWLLGVPSPIVWGILAMLMRFVPYLGPFIAAAPPLLLAAAVEPGWTMFLLVGVLFLVSELIMGQVVEPLVYGHGTGVSPIAVMFSTVFWTWLWGPLGLLLAMPLTVCLVVLGRHIEGLNFFEVMLGDEPALTPEQAFYQRALSGDSAEATYQAELALKDQTLPAYLDNVALKGLLLAERDLERGNLEPENSKRITIAVKEVMENLADFEPRRWFGRAPVEKPAENGQTGLSSLTAMDQEKEEPLPILVATELAPGWDQDGSILCVGGRNSLDDAAAAMLTGLLQKHGLKAKSLDHDAISDGRIVSLEANVKLVCLCYLSLGVSNAHVRYLVRRLRRIIPNATLVVGYWGENSAAAMKALKATAEADGYAMSLGEATDLVMAAARRPNPATEPDPLPAPERRPANPLNVTGARPARKSRSANPMGTKLPAAR